MNIIILHWRFLSIFSFLRLSFILLISLISSSIIAQPCHSYSCVVQKAEKAIQNKDYTTALDNLESASFYPESDPNQIADLRKQLLQLILKEKEQAKAAEIKTRAALKRAESDKNHANRKARDVFVAKIEQEQETKQAKQGRYKVEVALAKEKALNIKHEKLIDVLYFYDNKFALANKEVGERRKFGFINREGKAVISYQYENAEQFDHTGFAKIPKC